MANVTLKKKTAGGTEELYPKTTWGQVGSKPASFTPASHTHGNITNAGAIGSTSGLMLKTTTSGVITTLPAGTSLDVLKGDGTWGSIFRPCISSSSSNENLHNYVGKMLVCVGPAASLNIVAGISTSVWPIYGEVEVYRYTSADITITKDSGVALQSDGGKNKINNQYQAVIIKRYTESTYFLIGALK